MQISNKVTVRTVDFSQQQIMRFVLLDFSIHFYQPVRINRTFCKDQILGCVTQVPRLGSRYCRPKIMTAKIGLPL